MGAGPGGTGAVPVGPGWEPTRAGCDDDDAMGAPVHAGAGLRLLRAAVFSAVCVVLSATGHALASGDGIPPWAVLAGWAAMLCLVGPLAGRERSLPGIAATLLTGEFGLHLVFCLGQVGATGAAARRPGTVTAWAVRPRCDARVTPLAARNAACAVRRVATGPAAVAHAAHRMPGMAGMAGHGARAMPLSSMFTPAMLAAHLTAALVGGLVLRHGEAALWRVVRLSAPVREYLLVPLVLARLLTAPRMLALLVGVLRRLSAAGRRRARRHAQRLRSVALQDCLVRRGPPPGVAAT